LGKHPWQLTLRQFLDKVERDFGGARTLLFAVGPRGRADISFVAITPERLAPILNVDPDEELTLTALRSACIQLGIPPDLFGLEQEEPYYPSDTDDVN
jgi:hypothetical protein